MAEFIALDQEDIENFSRELEHLTGINNFIVIASNAYQDSDGYTRYYALLEKPGIWDYRYVIKDKLETIDSNTSSIESNTR
ncbi:hypothetical protein [Pedobacter sp. ASV28]|uniref:hypothetical protein n=1 Tax=Pedobacter sp. ASV28 TaxID=2795123 RepID=UPI0018ED8AE7|nr:hypothetical protein [Pedobacter sp. ASV28]